MGEVYLAEDTSELARTVALKIVPAEVAKNKDRLQRFTQEARTVSNLNHPNILTVYEFGQTDSVSFISTEYIDGVTLRKHLSGRRLKLIDILDLTIQIVAALNAAHLAGVTHRDLKPENVMVRKDHIVKVLDFGLAKTTETSLQNEIDSEAGTKVLVQTEPGLVMGTVSYMSPEQSAGKPVDNRTDIWSAGVVLYEMLAGVLPFQGKDIHRQIIAIQETEPAPLSQMVEGVPERLEEIVGKCLAKEKDERYQTAKDLLIDLRNLRRKLDVDAEIERTVAPDLLGTSGGSSRRNVAATSVAQAHPTSSAEYLLTEMKRHKPAVAIVVVVLLAAIIGSALYWRGRGSNSAGAINSIAVLPFQNRSSDADSEYLSDGLAESLIYRLSQLPNLKVSPTSAVMRYKGKELDAQKVASDLGVQAVMSGRVNQRGENLSISVELIDAANNKIIWGEQYERKMSDLLVTQREIATAITEKLQMKLSGEATKGITKRYTDSNEAYQLYLKGRFSWNKRRSESLKQAVEFYNQAIEKDPGFALAFAALAETYVLFANYEVASPAESMPQAKAAALRALALDDSLAEAHSALGWYLCQYEYDWKSGEKELRRAIELNPNYATAHQWLSSVLGQTKRSQDALAEIKRSADLDPLSPIIAVNVGFQLFLDRQFDESIAAFRQTLALHPDFAVAQEGLCASYNSKRDFQQALQACKKAFELSKSTYDKGYLSLVLGRAGHNEEAKKLLQELKADLGQRYVPKTALAFAHLGLNEKEEALRMLEQDVLEHGYWVGSLAVEPEFDELRSDPRFKALIKRTNLPE